MIAPLFRSLGGELLRYGTTDVPATGLAARAAASGCVRVVRVHPADDHAGDARGAQRSGATVYRAPEQPE